MALYFGTLITVFRAFYTLFSVEKVTVAFFKKNFNCSLNHIYLLTDKSNKVRLGVLDGLTLAEMLKTKCK